MRHFNWDILNETSWVRHFERYFLVRHFKWDIFEVRLLSETFSKKFSNIVAQLENLISLAFLCCLTLNLTELTHQCRPSKVLLLQLLSSYFFLSRLKLWNNFFTLTDIDTVYLSFLLKKKKSRASACHKERDGMVQLIFLLRIVHDIPAAQFSACIYKENFLHNKVSGFLNKKRKENWALHLTP